MAYTLVNPRGAAPSVYAIMACNCHAMYIIYPKGGACAHCWIVADDTSGHCVNTTVCLG